MECICALCVYLKHLRSRHLPEREADYGCYEITWDGKRYHGVLGASFAGFEDHGRQKRGTGTKEQSF